MKQKEVCLRKEQSSSIHTCPMFWKPCRDVFGARMKTEMSSVFGMKGPWAAADCDEVVPSCRLYQNLRGVVMPAHTGQTCIQRPFIQQPSVE